MATVSPCFHVLFNQYSQYSCEIRLLIHLTGGEIENQTLTYLRIFGCKNLVVLGFIQVDLIPTSIFFWSILLLLGWLPPSSFSFVKNGGNMSMILFFSNPTSTKMNKMVVLDTV